MAYKYAKGLSKLDGNLDNGGVISATGTNDIYADKTKSNLVEISGAGVTLQGNVLINNDGGFKVMKNTTDKCASAGVTNSAGAFAVHHDNDARIEMDINSAMGRMIIRNSSDAVKFQADSSGFSNITSVKAGATTTSSGNVTIGGSLTVNGTSATLAATDVELSDKIFNIAFLANDDTASHQAQVAFGHQANNSGSRIQYRNEGGDGQRFECQDGDGTGHVDAEALEWYGNGSGLTGNAASGKNVTWAVAERHGSSQTLTTGINIVRQDPGGSGLILKLPSVSGLATGTTVRLKAYHANVSNSNFISVQKADADGNQTIDGVTGGGSLFKLISPMSAVDITYLGSNKWTIL